MRPPIRIKSFVAVLAAVASAGLLLSGSAVAGQRWAEPTPFQKRLPGPKKFKMMEADYSGKVNTDLQFIADRQAIVNLITAYSFLLDEGRYDEYFELFSDDVVFEATVPCFGYIRAKGKDAFRAFFNLRYRGPGSEKNVTVRRHTMGNVHVAEQTATTAEVRTYMLISAAPPNAPMKPITTGTYNASMEKRDGRWIITRFAVEVDSPVKRSPAPKGLNPEVFELVYDDRPECE